MCMIVFAMIKNTNIRKVSPFMELSMGHTRKLLRQQLAEREQEMLKSLEAQRPSKAGYPAAIRRHLHSKALGFSVYGSNELMLEKKVSGNPDIFFGVAEIERLAPEASPVEIVEVAVNLGIL